MISIRLINKSTLSISMEIFLIHISFDSNVFDPHIGFNSFSFYLQTIKHPRKVSLILNGIPILAPNYTMIKVSLHSTDKLLYFPGPTRYYIGVSPSKYEQPLWTYLHEIGRPEVVRRLVCFNSSRERKTKELDLYCITAP